MRQFTFAENRSERATQAELLVPALKSKETRFKVLSKLVSGISIEESNQAYPMHFVWVLRDLFSCERNAAQVNRTWEELIDNWVGILDMPVWARELSYWRHPAGIYNGDSNYIVHPCHRSIGWTEIALNERKKQFGIENTENWIDLLIKMRQVLNTECDCFIQTPERLIVIECKDKTDFETAQTRRQQKLVQCLDRCLKRPKGIVYAEISNEFKQGRNRITWSEIQCILEGR